MQETPIEWTGKSANPIRARVKATGKNCHWCLKISPGCKNCYSSTFQPRFGGKPFELRFADEVEVWFDDSVLEDVLRLRKPTSIFWCSMTDMFGDWVPDEWIDKILATCALTPQHTHQILTKRAERLPAYFSDEHRQLRVRCQAHSLKQFAGRSSLQSRTAHYNATYFQWPLPQVHLGVSVEDQKRADERIPHLLRTPAAVRWLSCEPLLGPVDLTDLACGENALATVDVTPGFDGMGVEREHPSRIGWVVAGGESGPGARPMHPDWARILRDACSASGVPFFLKQLGGHPDKRGGDKALLDGRLWREMPQDRSCVPKPEAPLQPAAFSCQRAAE